MYENLENLRKQFEAANKENPCDMDKLIRLKREIEEKYEKIKKKINK